MKRLLFKLHHWKFFKEKYDNGKKWKIIRMKGWGVALVDDPYGQRQTISF